MSLFCLKLSHSKSKSFPHTPALNPHDLTKPLTLSQWLSALAIPSPLFFPEHTDMILPWYTGTEGSYSLEKTSSRYPHDNSFMPFKCFIKGHLPNEAHGDHPGTIATFSVPQPTLWSPVPHHLPPSTFLIYSAYIRVYVLSASSHCNTCSTRLEIFPILLQWLLPDAKTFCHMSGRQQRLAEWMTAVEHLAILKAISLLNSLRPNAVSRYLQHKALSRWDRGRLCFSQRCCLCVLPPSLHPSSHTNPSAHCSMQLDVPLRKEQS